MSVLSRKSIVLRTHLLLQRLRRARDAENPYSPAAALALLLAVGVAVKFVH